MDNSGRKNITNPELFKQKFLHFIIDQLVLCYETVVMSIGDHYCFMHEEICFEIRRSKTWQKALLRLARIDQITPFVPLYSCLIIQVFPTRKNCQEYLRVAIMFGAFSHIFMIFKLAKGVILLNNRTSVLL